MKTAAKAYLIGTVVMVGMGAQTPARRNGISVEMPVASHAVEVRAADDRNAQVLAITANGEVFVGVDPAEPAALSRLTARTVYVKADVRAPFQTVFAVLDALHGKSVVLLSAPPGASLKRTYAPPYGTKLIVSR